MTKNKKRNIYIHRAPIELLLKISHTERCVQLKVISLELQSYGVKQFIYAIILPIGRKGNLVGLYQLLAGQSQLYS